MFLKNIKITVEEEEEEEEIKDKLYLLIKMLRRDIALRLESYQDATAHIRELAKDFVVAGTASESLYGACESLFKPETGIKRQGHSDTFVMKIANNKVGLVIGKGGDIIKNMQTRSGARIQVIPLNLPPGDTSTERNVHIEGTSEQIEFAKHLVIEVTSEPEEVGITSHQSTKHSVDSNVINKKVSQEMFDNIIREVVEEIGVPATSLVSYIK